MKKDDLTARNPAFQGLIDSGMALKRRILAFLDRWPTSKTEAKKMVDVPWRRIHDEYRDEARELGVDIREWFNSAILQVDRLILSDQTADSIRTRNHTLGVAVGNNTGIPVPSQQPAHKVVARYVAGGMAGGNSSGATSDQSPYSVRVP